MNSNRESRLFNFLIAEITPIAFTNISWRYYLIYVCTNTLAFSFFYLFVPETKGRSLEDIDSLFIGAKNMLQPVKTARTIQASPDNEPDRSEKGSVRAPLNTD